MTSYDQVAYPNHAIPQSHPPRLAAIAMMLGMNPTLPEKARVLDIGCGGGGNLLPLALLYPDAEFVGIDLASTAIQRAAASAAALELSNTRFECVDLMELPQSFGQFDYILAHGFLSWVPDEVRRKAFAVCRERLTPHGVGYLSFNAYPGCRIRELFREVMLYHVRHIEDPEQRAAEARNIVGMMVAACDDDQDPVHQLVAGEYELLGRKSTGGLTHDDLNPFFHSLYFHEFDALAEEHGLQFLHEASYNDGQPPPAMSSQGAALLEDAKTRSFREYEQYMDFLKVRRFRQSLVVHREVEINRNAPHQAMDRFHYAAQLDRKAGGEPGSVEFANRATKAAVGTNDPAVIHALDRIGAAWPSTVPFAELGDGGPKFKERLERYAAAGIVDVSASPRITANRISERPEIWQYARFQAATGQFVTALTMNGIRMEDTKIRKLLLAADGTRTVDELAAIFGDRENVEKALINAAQFGFLIR